MLITPYSFIKPVSQVRTNQKVAFAGNSTNSGDTVEMFTPERIRAAILKHVSKDKANLDALKPYLENDDYKVRQQCCESIRKISKENEDLIPGLRKVLKPLLKDNDVQVQYWALSVLGDIGGPSKYASLAVKLLPSEYTHSAYWALLKLCKPGDEKIIKDLSDILKKEKLSSTAKEKTLLAIGNIGKNNTKAIKILKSCLDNPDTQVFAMKALGDAAKGNAKIIQIALDNITGNASADMKKASLETLGKIVKKSNPEIINQVIPLIKNNYLQEQTIQTLGIIGKGDVKATTDALLSFVEGVCQKNENIDSAASKKILLALTSLNNVNPPKFNKVLEKLMLSNINSSINAKYGCFPGAINDDKSLILPIIDPLIKKLPEMGIDAKLDLAQRSLNGMSYHTDEIINAVQEASLD